MTNGQTEDGTVVRIAAGEQTETVRETLSTGDWEVQAVGSTGIAELEPLVTVTRHGRSGFFPACSTDTASSIASALDDGFESALSEATNVTEHVSEPGQLPAANLDGMTVGQRAVLGPCGWLRPTEPAEYETAVGFDLPARDEIDEVGETILGRGWGDWCQDRALSPTWATARGTSGETTVVVNAHGTTADTLLLSSAPFAVLHGAMAVARATEAEQVVVYLSEDDERTLERTAEAVDRYPEPLASVTVETGPGVYRAAEPTMAIEAIEGNHRLEARLRPPGPEKVGIHGEPTVVHTARTVAHLANALSEGGPSGTRVVTVTGDIAADATVELPETASLADALDAVELTGDCKAACVGGQFGGMTDSLSVSPDPDSLREAGLGSEGVVELLGQDRCVVQFVGERAQFAADTNCGRCVPCREGTTQLAELLRDLYDGEFDRGGIEELIRVMETSSICAFGVDAGRPTRTAIDAFESEFAAHANGDCPAGSCPHPTTVP